MTKDRELTCPISLVQMTKPVTTNCNHNFDFDSINTWLKENSSCPLCRGLVNKLTINQDLYKKIYNRECLDFLPTQNLFFQRKVREKLYLESAHDVVSDIMDELIPSYLRL